MPSRSRRPGQAWPLSITPPTGAPSRALTSAVVAPEHLRRDPAPRPPALGQGDEVARLGTGLEAVGEPRRLLEGEVAGREGVGVAEAEQEVDVGGPGPDALHRDEEPMRLVGLALVQGVERQDAAQDRRRDRSQRPDLGAGQAGAPKRHVRGGRDRLGVMGAASP